MEKKKKKKRKSGKIRRARPNRLGLASLGQGPAWVQGLEEDGKKKATEHFKNWNTPSVRVQDIEGARKATRFLNCTGLRQCNAG